MLQYHPLKVSKVRREGERALRLTFTPPPELAAQYRYVQGQHLGLRVQSGAEELRRTYSICAGVEEQRLEICVRTEEPGKMSSHLRSVQPGAVIDVLTPNGGFHTPLDPASRGLYVGFAAGIGITPLLSNVSSILALEPHSRVMLFYGNRRLDSILFNEELQGLKNRHLGRFALHNFLSREEQDIGLYRGRLDQAKLAVLLATLLPARAVDHYFICGPGTMIEDLSAGLRAAGVDTGRIHGEHFSAAATDAKQPLAVASASDAAERGLCKVNVTIDGRSRSFTMRRKDQTVLDAAAEHGIDLPYSCRAGVCSTCRTRLLAGQVEMQQNYALEPWEVEAGFVLACQSMALSPELELSYDEK